MLLRFGDDINAGVMLCRTLLAPVVRGAENVPDGAVKERGCLFVGNHTQFGLYALPFLMYELYLRGHKVLSLSQHLFSYEESEAAT